MENTEISAGQAGGKMAKDATTGGVGAIIAGISVSQLFPDLDASTAIMYVGVLTGMITGIIKFGRNLLAQWLFTKGYDMQGNFIR